MRGDFNKITNKQRDKTHGFWMKIITMTLRKVNVMDKVQLPLLSSCDETIIKFATYLFSPATQY